jgi:hypothetical protein
MNQQSRIIVERFRSVHLDTLTDLLGSESRNETEKYICDMIVSGHLDGYRIDGDFVVRIANENQQDATRFREIFLTRINVLGNSIPV